MSRRLEAQGPFGDPSRQTSNRAELRAVLAALQFRNWAGEGFGTVVFATDSEYVAKGATQWVRTWLRNGWRTSGGPVKNIDLWEMLLGQVERLDSRGVNVEFWKIPREFNMMADRFAAEAAKREETPESFLVYHGVLV
jgi:ribonuclease HI